MPDAEQVAAVREALPATSAGIYLNTPVAGPLPAETAAAMAEIAEWDLRTGRAGRDRAEIVASRIEEARAAVAAILTVDLDDVLIAAGLRDALGRAVASVPWSPGDVVVVADDPSLAVLPALVPPGVTLTTFDPRSDPLRLPERSRLVALPIVDGRTGERLPVERIAAAAHDAGAVALVEGSLAVGAVPVDPAALGADRLVVRSEAWLLGPEGLAVLAGPGVGRDQSTAGFALPAVVGFGRGCGWLSMYVGWPWAHARAAALTATLAERLAATTGVELRTPTTRATTLVFGIDGWSAEAALDELGARTFLIAGAAGDDAIRLGVGAWNTDEELARLADAVALLAAHTPHTLPQRPRLTILGADR
jgi:L-cysteine/cystine lyase